MSYSVYQFTLLLRFSNKGLWEAFVTIRTQNSLFSYHLMEHIFKKAPFDITAMMNATICDMAMRGNFENFYPDVGASET